MYQMDNTNKKIHGNFANKYKHNVYKEHDLKFSIQDEQKLYDNTAASTTLFEARSGTLRLNDRTSTL